MNKILSHTVLNKPEEKYKKHTIYFLGMKFSFKTKFDVSEYGEPLIYAVANGYSAQTGIAMKIVNNKKEHEALIQRLKANLSPDSLKHLNRIIKRKDTIVKLAESGKSFANEKVYDKDELKELENLGKMLNEITLENGYYRYKHYKLPICLFSPCVFMHHHGIEALKTFDKLEDKIILDVGACIADSALMFRDFTQNPIICFEPVKSVYDLALKTVELNDLKDVKIENVGLSDCEKDVEINITPDHPDWGSISYRNCETKETIHCTTLDDYVEKNNLKVGLIKVDIEGEEPNFLKGAINTIKNQKPILLLSIYHNYHDFYKLKPWIEELNLGYKFDFYKGIDGDPISETMLLAEVY